MMKKNLLFCLFVLCIMIPVLANAGSVSSKYDVSFGGFVKYDLGFSTQNNHADANKSFREGSFGDEYSNTFMTAAETRFNFLVKGPDLWGAKTKAFIEGDFRGVRTGNSYGGFQLRHAFMNLRWDKAELMIGQNWQQWGMPYYGVWLGTGDFSQYLRGIRTPQIALRYFFTKEFNAMVGVTSATEWAGTGTGAYVRQYNDDYARSDWPGVQGEIAYWSDRCGKIGPNNLKLAVGGYYGREKKTYTDAGEFKDDTVDAWIAAFRYSLPIIPEKNGNKAMAVLLNGNIYLGQNVKGNQWLGTGGTSNGSYFRPDHDAAAPTVFGLLSQLSWWITDSLSANALYGYNKYNYSQWARSNSAAARDLINMQQSYAVNLLWNVNQAVRLGAEWLRVYTSYNGIGPGGTNGTGPNGTLDQYKVAAWYFF